LNKSNKTYRKPAILKESFSLISKKINKPDTIALTKAGTTVGFFISKNGTKAKGGYTKPIFSSLGGFPSVARRAFSAKKVSFECV